MCKVVLALLVSSGIGCGGMAIDGDVVDAAGDPIAQATITLVGSPCMALSDAAGHFELSCVPGVYEINISQAGYISEKVDAFDAGERKRYSLGRKQLVAIPKEKGLLRYENAQYSTLEGGFVRRKTGGVGMGKFRTYCIERERSKVNRFSPGQHGMFDYEAVGWKPFKADEDGCVYQMKPKSRTSWGSEYEKAEYQTTQVATGMKLVDITFEAGEYFIADWDQGFFTKASGEKEVYTGYYIRVE